MNATDTMTVWVWETNSGEWDLIVIGADGMHTRVTAYSTEAEATKIIRQLGWNLLSVVRCL